MEQGKGSSGPYYGTREAPTILWLGPRLYRDRIFDLVTTLAQFEVGREGKLYVAFLPPGWIVRSRQLPLSGSYRPLLFYRHDGKPRFDANFKQ